VAGRADVQRIESAISGLKGNGGRAKVIFACGSKGVWREFDAPGDFGCRMDVGANFTLAPLIAQQQGRRRYCIALADRNRARLLLLEAREIAEHSQVIDEDDREKIRTTGTGKSAHLERRKDEQARKHFCFLADHLLHFYEHKDYDALIIGCRDETWPEIEAVLHPNVKRILLGRIAVDPGMAGHEEIQQKTQALVDARDREDEQQLMERTMGGFAANARGAVGIHEVIDALEKGEVRTLLWASKPDGQQHSASLCEGCGHLVGRELNACTLCGAKMRLYQNAEEALLRHALGRSIEVREMHYTKLPMPDRIAAWLRFRAEVNTPRALAS
jgi:peptide subunit release factor 1 (eRF1)